MPEWAMFLLVAAGWFLAGWLWGSGRRYTAQHRRFERDIDWWRGEAVAGADLLDSVHDLVTETMEPEDIGTWPVEASRHIAFHRRLHRARAEHAAASPASGGDQ